jgi:hypothetical protein
MPVQPRRRLVRVRRYEHRELGPGIPNFVDDLYFWDFTPTMLGALLVLVAALVMVAKVFGLLRRRVSDATAKQLAFLLAATGAVAIVVKLLLGVDLDEEFQALLRDLETVGLTLADLGLDIGVRPVVGIYLGLGAGAVVAIGSLLAMKQGSGRSEAGQRRPLDSREGAA